MGFRQVAARTRVLWTGLAILLCSAGCGPPPLTVEVVGGSMAPTLLGAHHSIVCDECRFAFAMDGQQIPANRRWVCPNCGGMGNVPDTLQPSQVLTVQPASGEWERGDVVCFRDPESDRLLVKRIVGLPDESIEIRQGIVWAEEQPIDSRAPRLVVFDSRWQPPLETNVPNRFVPRQPDQGWERIDHRYRWKDDRRSDPANASDQTSGAPLLTTRSPNWLRYQQWRCYAHPGPRAEDAIINDHYGFNQAVSRDLYEVRAIAISVDFKLARQGQMTVRSRSLPDGVLWIERSEVGSSGVCRWLPKDGPPGQETSIAWHSTDPLRLLISHLGSTVGVTVNGRPVQTAATPDKSNWVTNVSPQDAPAADGSSSIGYLEIGGVQGTLWLDRMIIKRELFYDWPDHAGSEVQPVQLGADEYFLLGDNVPRSRDSRHFSRPGVPASSILGKIQPRPAKKSRSQAP